MVAPNIAPVTTLRVVIPGVPVAQGRGRAVRFGNSVRVIDPASSRSWKGAAQVHMLKARQEAGVYSALDAPLSLVVLAWWPRPKSLPKKHGPDHYYRPSRPDCDNVLKAVMDAGNGTLWADDCQIVRAVVEKYVCGVMDQPCVAVTVTTLSARASGGGDKENA